MSNKREYNHWSITEERQLVELRNSGLKFREIGEKMGRTAISVEKRYRKLMNGNDDKGSFLFYSQIPFKAK